MTDFETMMLIFGIISLIGLIGSRKNWQNKWIHVCLFTFKLIGMPGSFAIILTLAKPTIQTTIPPPIIVLVFGSLAISQLLNILGSSEPKEQILP